MSHIDAILHVADVPALIAAVAAADPSAVHDGAVTAFTRPPMVMAAGSPAGLCYVRLTPAEAAMWRGTPGVTVLAEAPYSGDGEASADAVYAALAADADAMALYDSVYDRSPVDDGEGGTWVPGLRIGAIA